MLVVHAHWAAGASALRLWAEDASRVGTASGRGDRSRVRPHPYAAPVRGLRAALEQVSAGSPAELRALEEWWDVLVLPTLRDTPVPSPGAVGEPRAALELAPWRVPSLTVGPLVALELLRGLAASRETSVVVADDVRYLAAVADLARDVVARGRVVPGLRQRRPPPGHDAAWLPALAGDLRARRDALAVAMPPVVRALEIRGGDVDPPSTVLDDALDALVDAAARSALRRAGVRPARGAAGLADAWLRALTLSSGVVRGETETLRTLGDDLAAWARARAERVDAIRLCLRLVAPGPGEPEDAWRIEALLQSTHDPTAVVDAAVALAAGDEPAELLGVALAAPAARVADELARAAAIHPPLAAMDHGVLELGTAGAYGFLRGAVVRLRAAGIGVDLPSFWEASAARLGVELVAGDLEEDGAERAAGGPGAGLRGELGLDGLVQVDWEVVLGGERISADELRSLARAEVPLVRLRGQWVELVAEDVERAVRLLETGRLRRVLRTRDVLAALLGEGPGADGLPVLGVRAHGALGRLLGAAGDQLPEAPEPAGLAGELRPYQRRGLAWLAAMEGLGVGACLADDMGLGKTIQVLALLLAEQEASGAPARTLLVCPMSLIENWRRESERFAPGLAVRVHHGPDRARSGLREAYADADLVITTYALLARDREELRAGAFRRVVLDEAQAIKNPSSAAARAARSLDPPRRIALTGTPVENRLAELWSIMEFLNPGLLGAAATFRRRFADPIELNGDDAAADRLARVTRPFLLRRLKTDRRIITDLPEKVEMKVYARLTPEQAALYGATVDELMQRVQAVHGMERRGLVLAALTRLKQICDHPRLVGVDGGLAERSGKLALLEEVLGEVLDIGERALVFTQYAQMGHLLHEHLADVLGREVLYLYGGLDRAARDRIVTRFHEPDGPHVLILSLRAGGQGLNLTAANHVVHVDRWWNPAVEDQATDRAFRIGQTRVVQVRKLIATGTVEERIDRLIERKRALSERIVGDGEAWLTELSNEDLRELVALSTDAVATLDEEVLTS